MFNRTRELRTAPAPEDLRRKLEGGLELIEATSRDYQLLADALRAWDWRHRLRVRPRLVRAVLERDAACLEALERATRRAQVEGWPEDAPVLEPLREAKQRREGLVAQVRAELARQGAVSETSSLEAGLRRLDTLVRERVPPEKLPAWVFREPGRIVPAKEVASRLVPLLMGVSMAAVVLMWGRPWAMLLVALLGFASIVVASLWGQRSGIVMLAPDRVALALSGKEAHVVRLDSIREGGILVNLGLGQLRVEGDQVLHVSLGQRDAERLRAGLEVFRHPELRARRLREAHPGARVAFPAVLHGGTAEQSGQAVLTRCGLYFLPGTVENAGAALLKAATGSALDSRVELSWVLETLRWQPESDVDAALLRAVEASGGVAWPAGTLRHPEDRPLPIGVPITFTHEAGSLTGQFEFRPTAMAADFILADWDEAPRSPAPGGLA